MCIGNKWKLDYICDMKHSVKDWVGTTRYWSFPVSAMPVVATVAFLAWKCIDIDWLCAALALVGNVVFHAAGNLLSDERDFRKGVDNERAYAVPNLVFHHFEPSEYVRFAAYLFGVGVAIGIVLTLLSGWQLLIVGVLGTALAASYSFFKFRALGDIFVFVCFGVLPVVGTSFVAAGTIDWSALVLSLPLGILTVAVLHDNNTVDIATDRESGIRTFAMALGERTSVKLYIAYMMIPYIVVVAFCVLGLLPFAALLCFLSAPLAAKNVSAAMKYFQTGRQAMMGLDQKTAQLHLVFSLLLSAGMVLGAIF